MLTITVSRKRRFREDYVIFSLFLIRIYYTISLMVRQNTVQNIWIIRDWQTIWPLIMKHLTVYQPEVEKGELTAKLTFRALALPQLTTKYFTCPPTRLNSFFKNSHLCLFILCLFFVYSSWRFYWFFRYMVWSSNTDGCLVTSGKIPPACVCRFCLVVSVQLESNISHPHVNRQHFTFIWLSWRKMNELSYSRKMMNK